LGDLSSAKSIDFTDFFHKKQGKKHVENGNHASGNGWTLLFSAAAYPLTPNKKRPTFGGPSYYIFNPDIR
jgi:hypothetical protein